MYIVPEEVLRGELSESLLKVQTSLEILLLFQSTYEDRRANLSRYRRNGSVVRPWDFSPLLVFSGLDRFINRVRTIKVKHYTLLKRWRIIVKCLCAVYELRCQSKSSLM